MAPAVAFAVISAVLFVVMLHRWEQWVAGECVGEGVEGDGVRGEDG